MPGTGHLYEILNVGDARQALLACMDGDGPPEAVSWFGAPQLLRFATGPSFTVPVPPADLEAALAIHVEDAGLRGTLVRKAAQGSEFRLFVPHFLSRLGPDLRHAWDWMTWLGKHRPDRLRKLSRMGVAAVVAASEAWTVQGVPCVSQGRQHLVEGAPGWVELLDEDALVAEGQAMNHCIGGYGAYLARGDRMFSLRDRDGGRLVTVHLPLLAEGSFRVGQIRGHSNDPPRPFVRPALVRLLNLLKVVDHFQGEARFAGVVPGPDGIWSTFQEVAERIEIAGLPAMAYGNEVWVMDPSSPDMTLVTAVGPVQGWHRGPACRFVRFSTGEAMSRSYERLQRFAAVANALCTVDRMSRPEGLEVVDGRFVPWPDRLERVSAGGADVLSRDGSLLVTQPGNPAQVLLTLHPGSGYAARGSMEVPRRDWSARELRHVAAVLTALKVRRYDYHDGFTGSQQGPEALEAAGLECWMGDRWSYLPDVVRTHPYGGSIPPDGRIPEWSVTGWRVDLRVPRTRGPYITISLDSEGAASWYAASGCPVEYLEDAARLLDDHGVVPSASYSPGSYPGWTFPEPGKDAREPLLMHIRGRWQLVESAAELETRLLAPSVGRRRKPASPSVQDARIALKMLPGPLERPDLAAYLADCLEVLATSSWASSMVWLHREAHRGILFDRDTTPPLVQRAEELVAGMTPRGQKALGSQVAREIARVIGRTRHAGVFSGEPVARAVLAFHPYLPRRTVERAVPWCVGIWGMRLHGTRGAHQGWLTLAETIDHREFPKASAVLYGAAGNLLWSMSRREAKDEKPLTPEDAMSLARCAVLVARASRSRRPYGFAEAVAGLREIAQACFTGDEGSWTGVLDTLEAIPEQEVSPPRSPWRPIGQEQEVRA